MLMKEVSTHSMLTSADLYTELEVSLAFSDPLLDNLRLQIAEANAQLASNTTE